MTACRSAFTTRHHSILILACCLVLLFVAAAWPASVHAAPNPGIPWIDDALASLKAALVKVLQDLLKGIGIVLWAVLKLCGAVGLLGDNFSVLFGSVITEAIDAVIGGSIRDVIRGSLMVSIGLFGLSLLARPFWPDLKIVNFQRAVVWGIAIQAYLLNAPGLYTNLETLRVDLADEVAQAVSSGSVPGCSGDTVHTILCIAGTNEAEVVDPSLSTLPDTIPPYGGSETIGRLYSHCVYNPPYYYGDADCDPDDPQGDPWAALTYAQEALGVQFLSLVLGFLILAYGVLQLALGLSAGMMFVLFPVAGIFAFYQPLESFPAGVVRNYISIFLKSVVLLTLAAVVIRLFTVASGNLLSLIAVGIVDLLLCGIMAREALASLLSNVSFIGNSVSSLGASVGLTGGGGGALPYPSPESRLAASLIGGGPVAQALMGAPNPYLGSTGRGMLGAAGDRLGSIGPSAQAAVSAALGAGTGGLGFVAGALTAAKGDGAGGLALMGQAVNTLFGGDAGRGFMTGAGAVVAGRTIRGGRPSAAARTPRSTAQAASPSPGTPAAAPQAGSAGSLLQPLHTVPSPTPSATTAHTRAGTTTPPATGAVQAIVAGQTADLSGWAPARARQIQDTATAMAAMPADVRQSAYDLMQAGHDTGQQWEGSGRSPFLENGIVDPQFVDDVIQQAPAAARAFTVGQARAGIPADRQLRLAETIALGAAQPPPVTPVTPEPPGLHPVTPALHPAAPAAPAEPSSATPESVEPDPALFERLRTWRREEADRQGKAAFHVFPDATLQRIAAARPQTEEELLAIKGVGPKKLAQFGPAVLGITGQGIGKPRVDEQEKKA